jgi:hypothetical protein
LTPSIHGDFIAYVSLLGLYGGMDKVPIFLCCWHVFKALCLHGIKKIKDVNMWGAIFQDLHDVMYMSINHGETIDDFKERGRVVMRINLHKHKISDAWTNYYWI